MDVEARKTNATGIAMSVSMNWKLKPWYKMEMTKEQEVLICEWWSGKLAYHQPCKKCRVILDRDHATSCSGAIQLLETRCNNWVQKWKDMVDKKPEQVKLINFLMHECFMIKEDNERKELQDIITKAICMIKEKCSGYIKDENGIWQLKVTENIGQNPARALRRRLLTIARNRVRKENQLRT